MIFKFQLAIIALWIAGLIGWIMNIMGIVHTIDGPITAMFVARVIGVFAAPLGAVLGYI